MAKYTGVSISGYNATPPSDDGTVSEANKVKWSTEKTKLTDPLKTAIESINTNLVSAFDVGPTSLVTNTTLGTSHYGDFIQVSGSGVTLTLTDAATLGAGWYCEIVNTDSTNTVTIGRATGADTINGTAANISLLPYQAISVFVNAEANGFISTSKRTHTKEDKHESVLTMGSSVWMAEGAAVASATDCNIWTTDGNTVHISGTTEIQDWGTAPQAGAWKWVIFDDALQLTYNATTNKTNTNGANYTTVAGDRALIYADDTGTFVVTIFPLDDKNFQALPLMPSFDSIGTTATQTYTSGTNPLTVPDDIYWMVFTGSAGGGGGGCTSGGTPSAPTNGGDTTVSINGVTVLTLTGGQGGLNNTTTGTRNGGTAKIKTAASVYGKTRQLVGYVRTFIGGLVDGNSVTDSAVGASSQFGTAGSNGAGGNGQSTNLAGAAGASCDLLFIPVRPGDSVSVVIGAAGVRGIGDNQGQDGGAGFMHIEY